MDHGDGAATLQCPDGTSVRLTTGGVDAAWRDAGDLHDGTATSDRSAVFDAGTPVDSSGVERAALDAGGPADVVPGAEASTEDAGADAALPRHDAAGDVNLLPPEDAAVPSGPCQGFPREVVVEGSASFTNSLQLADLTGTQCITGDLSVTVPGLSSSRPLASLRVVGGDLVLSGVTDPDGLDLSALEHVAGALTISGGAAPAIALGQLQQVDGNLLVQNTWARSLDLSTLTWVGGRFIVLEASQLEELALPELTRVVACLSFSNLALLRSLSAPRLTRTGLCFELINDAQLAHIDFASLARVDGSLHIDNNPQLPLCQAQALRDQVLAADGIGASASIFGCLSPCVGVVCDAGACAIDCARTEGYVCQ